MQVTLLFEYEAVLKRDSQRLVHGVTDAQLERALQLITQACDLQPLHFLWRPQLQDVADEMVLETAINARVDMLVSFKALNTVESLELSRFLDQAGSAQPQAGDVRISR